MVVELAFEPQLRGYGRLRAYARFIPVVFSFAHQPQTPSARIMVTIMPSRIQIATLAACREGAAIASRMALPRHESARSEPIQGLAMRLS